MIKFVEEKEGLGFREAVELLADRYGVELERENEDPRAEEAAQAARAARRAAGADDARSTRAYLWESEEAGKAREYLDSRGLGEEVLRAFGVGYAPSAWDQVLTRGQRAGFSVAELRGGGAGPEGAEGRALRPLPRADHVPGARPRAGGCRGSGRGRCAPTGSRST